MTTHYLICVNKLKMFDTLISHHSLTHISIYLSPSAGMKIEFKCTRGQGMLFIAVSHIKILHPN